MEDVVLNRRILITLIPALEKSADEVSSLGKINVAGLKDMMGKSIGNALTGDREEIILNKRSEEHTSELQSLMRISYDVFCLKKKIKNKTKLNIPNVHNSHKYNQKK